MQELDRLIAEALDYKVVLVPPETLSESQRDEPRFNLESRARRHMLAVPESRIDDIWAFLPNWSASSDAVFDTAWRSGFDLVTVRTDPLGYVGKIGKGYGGVVEGRIMENHNRALADALLRALDVDLWRTASNS